MRQSVHRQVGRRLLLEGLPPAYVERVIAELEEHEIDSAEGFTHQKSNGCLGVETEVLASQFVTSYRTSKWFGRLPGFYWILFPIPLCLVSYFLGYAITVAPAQLFIDFFEKPMLSPGETMAVKVAFYTGKMVGPLLAAWVLFQAQQKAGISHRTKVGGFLALALMFFITMSDLVLHMHVGGRSLTLCVDMERAFSQSLLLWQLAQSGIVLAVLAVEVRRWRSSFNRLIVP